MKRSQVHKILTLDMCLLPGSACLHATLPSNASRAIAATAIPSHQPADEIVNHVNNMDLLAELRPDEIQTILIDWASRDVSVQNCVEVHSSKGEVKCHA
jgi:hypothetical protein